MIVQRSPGSPIETVRSGTLTGEFIEIDSTHGSVELHGVTPDQWRAMKTALRLHELRNTIACPTCSVGRVEAGFALCGACRDQAEHEANEEHARQAMKRALLAEGCVVCP